MCSTTVRQKKDFMQERNSKLALPESRPDDLIVLDPNGQDQVKIHPNNGPGEQEQWNFKTEPGSVVKFRALNFTVSLR